MPGQFPDIWLGRVVRQLNRSTDAPFLEGISELAVPVTSINAGDLSEVNKIYVPKSIFNVDVLINNGLYPIAIQNYSDDLFEITLDKYQTKVTTLSDDQTIGASHDRIDDATKAHIEALLSSKYRKAIWNLAPAANGVKTPVMATTGADDGTGRKRLTYNDLVEFKKKVDATGANKMNRRLVLCDDHWNDILLDRANFGDQMINYKEGSVVKIAGFELQNYSDNPNYTTAGAKVAFNGTVAGMRQASVYFNKENVGKKTGLTRQYFLKAEINPRGQSNELNYRHYFVTFNMLDTYFGAITSGTV